MNRRIVPIIERHIELDPPLVLKAANGRLVDTCGRLIADLRISVTDRCNFRCQYCMPRSVFGADYPFLPQKELLTFDEITRLARLFAEHGVSKLRLTGGEPLLRRNIERLIEQLAQLRTPAGEPLDVTLTTNGSLLAKKAQSLKDAGLGRVTVSLDAMDDAIFKRMNDADFAVADVLEGIEAAEQTGFGAIKINMVVQNGVNEGQVIPMLSHFRGTGHIVRLIEFMDVGATNGWALDQVFPSADLIAMIDQVYPLEPLLPSYLGEVANRWRYRDGQGELGVISSVSQPFCGACTRARLSTDGSVYTCLFATQGIDLRHLLRQSADDQTISNAIRAIWEGRADRYSEIRGAATTALPKVEMSYIGG